MMGLEQINIEAKSAHFRMRIVDTKDRRVLIANFHDSEQEKDLARLVEEGGEALIPYDQLFGVSRAAFAAVRSVRTGKRQKI